MEGEGGGIEVGMYWILDRWGGVKGGLYLNSAKLNPCEGKHHRGWRGDWGEHVLEKWVSDILMQCKACFALSGEDVAK